MSYHIGGIMSTYRDLVHGTDMESAENILAQGFELRGNLSSWCGEGVYFYRDKDKAWWAAKRKCHQLKKGRGRKVKAIILFADICELPVNNILDLRKQKDFKSFKDFVQDMFDEVKAKIRGDNETLRQIRAALISFYAYKHNKKLIVGDFEQEREQDEYDRFAQDLHIINRKEEIFCIKDTSIIGNVRKGVSS